jgi:hypothetical protein
MSEKRRSVTTGVILGGIVGGIAGACGGGVVLLFASAPAAVHGSGPSDSLIFGGMAFWGLMGVLVGGIIGRWLRSR